MAERFSVTTDQYALIHKILSRYPQKFTVLRELVQNADDANAREVNLNVKWHGHQSEIIVKNNGNPFTSEDWAR